MKPLFFLLALLSFGSANAANWQLLSESDTVTTLVDADSIATSGKLRKAWFQHIDSVEREGNSQTGYKKYTWAKTLAYFSCEERTSATLQMLYYDGKPFEGNFLGSWNKKLAEANLNDVAPDTVGEMMLNYVCDRKIGKK